MAGVELRGVTKRFGRCTALSDVHVSIADGEFFVVVGPSGCGKTTLLRIIAGLEHVSSGSVWMDGVEVTSLPPRERDVAMVFQNLVLYPHLTVAENLAFGLRTRKIPESEVRRRVEETGAMLGISHLFDRLPRHLSGGEKQRVALGRAVVRRPRMFLFDEPIGNLDAELQTRMRAEFRRIHRELRTTVVYVTHDQHEAMALGDRICVLRAGSVQQVGDPVEVYDRPANRFVAGFFGTPPMNMLSVRLNRTGAEAAFAVGGVRLHPPAGWLDGVDVPPGGDCVIGVRPEHIVSADSGGTPLVVDICEPYGSERLVHLSSETAPDFRIRARLSTCAELRPGKTIRVSLVWDRVMLFDVRSDRRLR